MMKIISGGQSGVDRAALDAALAAGLQVGGWCPRGRLAEDGVIDPKYPLLETPSTIYSQRTEWNVRDSDSTLILYRRCLRGGSLLTREITTKYGKPCRCVDLEIEPRFDLPSRERDTVLNIAGPRESQSPGIYQLSFTLLYDLFFFL